MNRLGLWLLAVVWACVFAGAALARAAETSAKVSVSSADAQADAARQAAVRHPWVALPLDQ